MDKKQHAALTSFEQVQRFLNANADALPGVSAAGATKRLDEAVTNLAAYAAMQGTAASLSKDARAKQLTAKRVLLEEHMQAIASVARANLAGSPDYSALKAPSAHLRTKSLLDAAESMAQVAATTPEVFVTAGLPADFVEQLRSSASQLQQHVASGQDNRQQRAAATKAAEAAVKSGHDAVRILNPLVKRALAGNVFLLTEWKNRRKSAVAAAAQAVSLATVPTPVSTTTPVSSQTPPSATPMSTPQAA